MGNLTVAVSIIIALKCYTFVYVTKVILIRVFYDRPEIRKQFLYSLEVVWALSFCKYETNRFPFLDHTKKHKIDFSSFPNYCRDIKMKLIEDNVKWQRSVVVKEIRWVCSEFWGQYFSLPGLSSSPSAEISVSSIEEASPSIEWWRKAGLQFGNLWNPGVISLVFTFRKSVW